LARSKLSRPALAAGSGLTTCILIASGPACAASPTTYEFRIRPRPAAEALIDFAVQSNLSIGGAAACTGMSPGLIGRFTLDEGLQRLLQGAGCRYRRIASDTIRILPPSPSGLTGPGQIASVPSSGDRAASPTVQELVVSATKRAATVDQLPYAVSALGADDLRIAGAMDIDDVASQLASISTTNLGPGRNKILMRGLSDGAFTGRTQSTVGIYLDDVPITYNAPDLDLHLGDLDSVEVLRGPQGTLYGGGSMSGIYRIVTRKPEVDQFSGSLRTSGQLTLGGGASNQLEGMLNIPVVREKAAARFLVYQDIDGGYIDDINLHQAQIDRSVRTGARGYARWDVDPTLTLTGGLAFQSIRANDTQYISANLGRLRRANEVREASSNDFSQGVVTVEKTGAWGNFRSTTSFVRHKFASRSDASNALPLFANVPAGVGSYDEPSHVDMLVEDAVWTSPSIGRLQWLTGLFASRTTQTTEAFVRANNPYGLPAQLLYQEHRTDGLLEGAVYGEATFSLTDSLQATAGARAFINSVDTHSQVDDPQSGRRRIFDGSAPNQGISPKVALSYRLPNRQLLYVSVEEGHRTGGFNTGGLIGFNFVTDPKLSGVRQRFGADELWNYEAGSKLSLFADRLRIRNAVFYNVWRNIQTDQFMSTGLSYTANAGDGRNLGFETEAIFRVTPDWELQANALVDDPLLEKPNPGFVAKVHLPGVPDLLVGARTEYRFPLAWNLQGLLTADARYVGRSQLTFNPNITAPMGGYVLSRLSAQVSGRRWRLAAFLSNPSNAAGNTFSYGNPFNFQQVREVTPQRPRSIRLLLSAEF
jgi:outer membrane receptor protein involved in Fe transport